jgi:hypothetical protein
MKYHDGWVGVDLDGTLAHYEEYKGDDHVGAPIKPMVEKVKQMLADGYDVRIMTARKPHPAIRDWCKIHLGKVLPITSTKDKHMIALYDDRAVGVRRNEGVPFHEDNETQVWRKD